MGKRRAPAESKQGADAPRSPTVVNWSVESSIERSARVQQIEGIFDVPAASKSKRSWSVSLPLDERPWNVGLIVGPSGAGKSTLAAALWPEQLATPLVWRPRKAVVDEFPEDLEAREVAGLLSAVGFASPPAWLRPFAALSNGEQFRVAVARRLAGGINTGGSSRGAVMSTHDPIVVDEFTSVVDRQVAKIGSCAVAREVRRRGLRLVAVTCHYDVIDWLAPDWVCEPATGEFTWGCLRRRPDVQLEIRSAAKDWRRLWRLFGPHHYLSADLAPNSQKFVALVEGRPAAFVACLPFPHPTHPGWREHRTVCLPDYQGVGIGNALSDWVASVFGSTGFPYRSTTSSPAMIRRRASSRDWFMRIPPKVARKGHSLVRLEAKGAFGRIVASFEWRGANRHEVARKLGLRVKGRI